MSVRPPAALRLLLAAAAAAGAALVLGGAGDAAPASVTAGEHLYGRYCAACHGLAGVGVAPGSAQPIGAAPLRDQVQQKGYGPSLRGVGAQAADFYLRTGYMPLARTGTQPHRSRVLLGDAEIRDLTAYVAALGAGPQVPTPHPERGALPDGLRLFTDHCAGCHQVVAQGGYVTGGVPPSLQHASAVQIAEAVRIGPYVMPRFSTRAISDHDLDSIIAYVQYAKRPDDRGGWAIGHIGPVPEGLVTWGLGAVSLVAICMLIGARSEREG
jgi:ubiquinol-cytochrome c reductase cytochrome c subunit